MQKRIASFVLGLLILTSGVGYQTKAEEAATPAPTPEEKPFLLERTAWSFDRSNIEWYNYDGVDPEKKKAEGKIDQMAGWAEYDFNLPDTGWYELWEKDGVPGWARDLYLDGKPLYLLTYSMKEDIINSGKERGWYKEANLYLDAGKHTLRIRRLGFPGVLPALWQLRAGKGRTESCIRAEGEFNNVVSAGTKITLPILGGTTVPTKYELVLLNETLEGNVEVGVTATIEFPATETPILQQVPIEFPNQGVFFVVPRVEGKLLRPADLKASKFIVIDTNNPPAPSDTLQTTTVVEIDCVGQTINGQPVTQNQNYFEKDGATTIVNAPFGQYRQSSGNGRSAPGHHDPLNLWGLDGFSYRFDLPDSDHTYRLRVTYPDDQKRSCGFWVNDGADQRNGVVCTGGVESGGLYTSTNAMQVHEAFFYPLNNKDLIVAVINLNKGCKAAAAKIVIDRIDSTLPATAINKPQGYEGRSMGYYFEEPGRWTRFFGARKSESGHLGGLAEEMASIDRWGQWNRFVGANLMFPTINVYGGNCYPSKLLDGYLCDQEDRVRMVALMAQKYGGKFIPEFHLRGRPWFEREIMGIDVQEEKKDGKSIKTIHFTNNKSKEYLLTSKDGEYTYSWVPFIYNALHPDVQQKYIDVFGELADRLGDIPAFEGISSRLMLSWQWQGWNALPGLEWGYGDWTVAQFTKDTDIKVPGLPDDPQRFRKRFDFLSGPMLETWQNWRCTKIFDFHRRLRDRIRQAKPDAKLFFTYFGSERWTFSNTQLGKMREFGMDWRMYSHEPGMVVIPSGTYGRRFSNPIADAEKVEPFMSEDYGRIGRLGGRGFAIYGDYYEVNENLDWSLLGGKSYNAFDSCSPSGIWELQTYATVVANNDTSFIINGGNGWVFGTPKLLQPFMQEYRALPAEQFTKFEKGRDPAAVWMLQKNDGLYFYAVNRLPVELDVTLTLNNPGQLISLSTQEPASLEGNKLTFKLSPFMLKSFKAEAGASLTDCETTAPKAYIDSLQPLIKQASTLLEQLRSRTIAPELSDTQASSLMAMLNTAVLAAERKEWAAVRDNLTRLEVVQFYSQTGTFPTALYEQKPFATPSQAASKLAPPELKLESILGDTRGRMELINDLCYDPEGRLWATSGTINMCFDQRGNYLKSVRLLKPFKPESGDTRTAELTNPKTVYLKRLALTPDKRLTGVNWETPPSLYETMFGRLLDLNLGNNIVLPNQNQKSFRRISDAYTVDLSGNIYAACDDPEELAGVYKYRPDGSGIYEFVDVESGNQTNCYFKGRVIDLCFDADGTGYLALPQALVVLGKDMQIRTQIALSGQTSSMTRVAVNREGSILCALSDRGFRICCFRKDESGSFALAWSQKLTAQANAIAMNPQGLITIGFSQAVNGAVAINYRLLEKEMEFDSMMIAGLAEDSSVFLNGFTQLKRRDDGIYFISGGKLMRMPLPSASTKTTTWNNTVFADVVFDPQIRQKQMQSFAFAPNGDLYLAGNFGFYSNSRGANLYRAAKQAEGWSKPEMLTGKPLIGDAFLEPLDLEVQTDGSILLRLRSQDKNLKHIEIFRYHPDSDQRELLVDLGKTNEWGSYGLHQDKSGKLFIAGGASRSVACLDASGNTLWKRSFIEEQPHRLPPLRTPVGITTDSKGRVWCSDFAANKIVCFSANGELLGTFGTYGNLDNRDGLYFYQPAGIVAVQDNKGNEWLYVADTGNQRILKMKIIN